MKQMNVRLMIMLAFLITACSPQSTSTNSPEAAANLANPASENCPKDQPISACQVTPEQQIYTVTLDCGVETPAK